MTTTTKFTTTSNSIILKGITHAKSSIKIGEARRKAYSSWTMSERHEHVVRALSTELPAEFDARKSTDYRNQIKRSWTKIFDENGRTISITGNIKKGFDCSSKVTPPATPKTPVETTVEGEGGTNENEGTTTNNVDELVESFVALTKEEKESFLEKLGLKVK